MTAPVGGRPRSTVAIPHLGLRSLLTGCVMVAAAGLWGLVLTLNGAGLSVRGASPKAPRLVSYHHQADAVAHGNTGTTGHFTITGDATKVLYPGRTSSIDLAFTNKTGAAIALPATSITITLSSPRPTCPASPNFSVVQTLTTAITIPAGATNESLTDLGITTASWPIISMVTTHVNQDACEGMQISLHYAATVTTTGTVSKGTTGTGSGSGIQSGGGSSSGSSKVPVETATGATSGGALAFTGLDVGETAGSGALLLVSGIALLTWRRRLVLRR